MLTASKKTKIRHRNEINSTFARMPLNAKRVLFLMMAQIDSKKLIPEGRVYEVRASDYSRLCNVDVKTSYRHLKSGARQLHKQIIEIPQTELLKAYVRRPIEFQQDESQWRGMRLLHITESCSYVDKEGLVQLRFSRQVEPYICMLEKEFTTQLLLSSIQLSDSNANNLYQYLRFKISSGKTRFFEIEVDQLRKDLMIEKVETYQQFKFFKSQFLDRSIKKLLSLTEFKSIDVVISEKIGRKAHKLLITYEYDS